MRKARIRRIAIVYPASVPWMARCLDGIRRYAREQGDWHLFSSPPTLRGAEESALTLHAMRGWKGDAIIAATSDANELRVARNMRIPVVNLAAGSANSHGIIRVMVNHEKAGQMAADHLLARGLRHLAFFGWKGLWYSELRQRGFYQRARSAGVKCDIRLLAPHEESVLAWPRRIAGAIKWLSSLPRPTGIFAVHDYRAQLLIEACHEAGLRIPDDIAVIGMDNDETVCEHSAPTLTSVSRNSEEVGWAAASLLHRMMQGQRPTAEDVLLDPDGVVERRSTDMIYCEDPVAQAALDYMRGNLRSQFNIGQLADTLDVSKRTLETRFRKDLKTSPHDFLTRLRFQKALTLLKMPQKRTAEQIAGECGFGTVRAFQKVFRNATGETFSAYRKRHSNLKG